MNKYERFWEAVLIIFAIVLVWLLLFAYIDVRAY